jgi:thiol-disulfide isomerase/thioredoxin
LALGMLAGRSSAVSETEAVLPKPAAATKPAAPTKAARRRKLAVEVLVVVSIFFAIRFWNGSTVASGEIPAMDLTTIAGEHVSLGEHPNGYVVHFFATWCGVCRAEEGNVASLAEGHEVIAIASQSGGADAVGAYVDEAGLQAAHVVLDPSGAIAQRFGVRAFPTTLYVSRDGTIATSEVGYTSALGMRLRAWWAE